MFPPMLSRLLPDPIFVHDHDGRILMVTDSACASVQYSREALLSMNVVDLDQSFDLSAAQAAWSRMDSGVRHTLRGTHRRMDGSRFPVQIHLHVEEHRGQRIYFASVHDLSEQLRQEEHLRARALDLGNVFSSMAEGLVLQAKDGRIIEANPAAERILGLSRDELLGKTSIDPDWRCIREDGSPFPGEEHPAMQTLRTGRPITGALMGVHDRGPGLRWIRINTQPVLGDPKPSQCWRRSPMSLRNVECPRNCAPPDRICEASSMRCRSVSVHGTPNPSADSPTPTSPRAWVFPPNSCRACRWIGPSVSNAIRPTLPTSGQRWPARLA
ncbi:MAG: PAS domain S-box protein [Proteobacteria bacterium]|nr:PAS domain S-box protein [Pseudomonadota bacterium]